MTLRVWGVSFCIRDADMICLMNAGVRERIEELRRQIAVIQKLNLAYLQTPKPSFAAVNEHARRGQKLMEIMEELRAMTESKKT